MIQKLTVNLKKSEDYGKKVAEQLSLMGKQIMQTKIDCALLMEKINQVTLQSEQMSMMLKKQVEESSNYEYKRQKLQIRMKQYEKKLQLQQQIFQKKQSYQQKLKAKVQNIEKDIHKEDKFDEEIQKNKQEIEEIDFKINKQAIGIENLYHEYLSKNKQARQKQDQLVMKKKSNIKKKQMLQRLNGKLGEQENKENNNLNFVSFNEECRIKELKSKNLESIKKMSHKLSILVEMYEKFDLMSELNGEMREQINKSAEIIQESRIQKLGLMKTKEVLEEYRQKQ